MGYLLSFPKALCQCEQRFQRYHINNSAGFFHTFTHYTTGINTWVNAVSRACIIGFTLIRLDRNFCKTQAKTISQIKTTTRQSELSIVACYQYLSHYTAWSSQHYFEASVSVETLPSDGCHVSLCLVSLLVCADLWAPGYPVIETWTLHNLICRKFEHQP